VDIGRVFATAIIWIGCFGLVGANIITGGSGIVTLGILFIAMLASVPIWESKESDKSSKTPSDTTVNPEKLKREDSYDQKMRLLMELMDDDEREAFKQTLKQQVISHRNPLSDRLIDGELPFDADEYEHFTRK
jgi:hypothetical protein